MTRLVSNPHERNTVGLQSHAQKKAEETRKRAEKALALLTRERRPITFKAVAEVARISTAWLYANEDFKQRIIHLRSQQTPGVQVQIPPKEQASNASKDAMIVALQKKVKEQTEKIKEQAEEIKELKKQVEVAYGVVYKRQQ